MPSNRHIDDPADSESRHDPRAEIAKGVLDVHEASYGTGAESVDVFIHEDLVVVMLNELGLTAGERTMIVGGRPDIVLDMRGAFQVEIGPTFTAIVERATGRRVSGFLSNTCLEPLFSVELFRLAPQES
jgi:uncharacterized protein YbcI